MNSDQIIITDKQNKGKILDRKPINQIMNLEFLKNFSKSANIDSIITLYSSKQLYISPKLKLFKKKKVDKQNKINISPNKQKVELMNKNNLNNNKQTSPNNKENKIEKYEIRKYNYKKKININKHKLNKNKNKDNNLILGNLIDNENEGTFDNNSLEKIKIIKFNDYINNKINIKEKNKNKKNNIFDMGSISHISKNGSSSAREKNIEEEIKNNNAFEKIVCDFVEEENCKILFKNNEFNKENIDNNENNQINQQYKSKALKEIIDIEENNNNENVKRKYKNNHEKEKNNDQIASEFIDSIMIESVNEVAAIEKFVDGIFIDSVALNFVKIIFEEILNEFKKKKEKEKRKIKEIRKHLDDIRIIDRKNNNKEIYNNIGFINYKKITNKLNNINNEKIDVNIKSENHSESKPLFKSFDEENEKEKNNLMESQEKESNDLDYRRITTIPGVSKNFRTGFLRKNSIRREYQQKKYGTLNVDNSEQSQ